jgi:hypothetical protein
MKRSNTIAALVFALSLPLANPVAADQLGDGLAAYDSGDYAAALKLMGPLAEQGSARAQFRLGEMYMFGRGTTASTLKAMTWYLLSADNDFPRAQFALGFMYMNAIGVDKNDVQALRWFRICERHAGFGYSAGKSADLVKRKMTSEQIAEAERLAQDWKPKTP